jgi:hypothetical protein
MHDGGTTMTRVATVLAALAAVTLVAGCGGSVNYAWQHVAADDGGVSVMTGVEALPEGHPPLDGRHRSLPEGHPPVPGLSPGLPEDHPVCPAGRKLLERGLDEGRDPTVIGPEIIST